jgi:hypothetical protein
MRWACDTLYPQKLELASPTSGDRSIGRVRSRTKATEFYFCVLFGEDFSMVSMEAEWRWRRRHVLEGFET